MNNSVSRLIKRKRKSWFKYKSTLSHSNYLAYAKCRNASTKAVRNAKFCFERNLVNGVASNPKRFWKYVHSKTKLKQGIGALERSDGSLTSDESEMAELLNNFFSSVFTNENLFDVPSLESKCLGDPLSSVHVSLDCVWKQLCNLDPCKSSGPDDCHPRVFKEVKEGLLQPLFLIFKKSLEEGQLPSSWKDATVTPIFKKGCRSLPSNYRPVSLTSIVCKMLECIIKDCLMKHFTINNLFAVNQHGFRPGHSCVTQLLKVMENWTNFIDSGASVDVIYLDFQKAFDRVPHGRLLSKVKSYGIEGSILRWIQDFLRNRRQQVHIRGSYSGWISATSGVPQGSVLGPIFFLIFVNDLPQMVSSMLYLFADDTKLYHPIRTPQDCVLLQRDLARLVDWCDRWQMAFNVDKCHVMSIGNFPLLSDYTMKFGDSVASIVRVQAECDLGVTFASNLTFDKHISNIVRRANILIGIIKRTFSCLDQSMFRTLYTTLIRPHLDYASVVWNPYQLGHIRAIEKVQRRATRIIPEFRGYSYFDRLKALNLPSLVYRRRRMDMIMVYKIIHGLDGSPFDMFFMYHDVPTRSNGYKLFKKFCHLNVRKYSFSQRVVNDWNTLPIEVVQAPDVESFKTKLDLFWNQFRFDYI